MEWIPVVFLTFKAVVLFTGMYFAIKWHYDQDSKRKNETIRPEMRVFAAMIIALTIALIGIVYAGSWGNIADGGRGGALGCALTFMMVFMSRPKVDAILADRQAPASDGHNDTLGEPAPAMSSEGFDQLARFKAETERLRAALVVGLDAAQREKIYLGIASLVSALAWKYGDIAAALLDSRH
ncbi:MAG: hypothetical protein KGJ57_21005 [Sphingomonadales bacterium]|nr:hypothetical protein [Sphingomonadales bacterium]MDE2171875.1 hypothetical protein [Sphingomonadales bacterium]